MTTRIVEHPTGHKIDALISYIIVLSQHFMITLLTIAKLRIYFDGSFSEALFVKQDGIKNNIISHRKDK